jgi:hypothetical protein
LPNGGIERNLAAKSRGDVMKHLALILAASAALAASASAQTPYQAPRLSDGQPDLQGQWTNESSTTLERDRKYGNRLVMTPAEVMTEEDSHAWVNRSPLGGGIVDPTALATVMRVGGQPRTSLITSTPDGRLPPRKPGAVLQTRLPPSAARTGYHDNPETDSNDNRCLAGAGYQSGPVLLPALRNNNYQIIQSKDSVAIETEMVHDVRVIRLNANHRTDGVRPWFGDSIGHYEGDTLVVETTNFPRQNVFHGSWEHLKVTERFTRVGDKAILYRFTVDDPTLWTKPWSGEYEFHPASGPIYEYACHEGNYDFEFVLAAARAEDAKTAATARPMP